MLIPFTNIYSEIKLQITPTPTSIADIGQRKSKKKRAASPVASASSGEEYDPRADHTATMSVAAPKPKHPRPKTPKTSKTKTKSTNSKSKDNIFFMNEGCNVDSDIII